jgi:hypothetical protein
VWLLEDLRRLGVSTIDLAVVDPARTRTDLDAIVARIPVGEVLLVPHDPATSGSGVGRTHRVGAMEVAVASTPDGPVVEVLPAPREGST